MQNTLKLKLKEAHFPISKTLNFYFLTLFTRMGSHVDVRGQLEGLASTACVLAIEFKLSDLASVAFVC